MLRTLAHRRLPKPTLTDITHARRFHNERIPSYSGWWTLISNQPTPTDHRAFPRSSQTEIPPEQTLPPDKIPVVADQPKQLINVEPELPKSAADDLNGVVLPVRPEPPDNCCMSACHYCVWDIYNESLEEYQMALKTLWDRLVSEGSPVPVVLKELVGEGGASGAGSAVMDPGMKAFLEMEKRLNGAT